MKPGDLITTNMGSPLVLLVLNPGWSETGEINPRVGYLESDDVGLVLATTFVSCRPTDGNLGQTKEEWCLVLLWKKHLGWRESRFFQSAT